MGTTYFLGANSRDGFFSLYGEFCRGRGDYLHIIKGGPGTGKSGFMRRIARAAEDNGLEVDYILCSGDPESLDGIYIPKLKLGWVDGTAPHVLEPGKFGVDSDYVNLGEFCSCPLAGIDHDYVNSIYELYRGNYSAAYDCLKAASLLRRRTVPAVFTGEHRAQLQTKIKDIFTRHAPIPGTPTVKKRFYHALCCKGQLYLNDSVNLLCKHIYVFESEFEGADAALKIAAEEAMKYSGEVVLSYSPRDPEVPEAVLIPGLELAFAGGGWEFENAQVISLDSMLPREKVREHRPHVREIKRLEERITALACDYLAQAKELHDELEEVYKAAMDFRALDEFTEEYIKANIG